jgi:hypothetical protein
VAFYSEPFRCVTNEFEFISHADVIKAPLPSTAAGMDLADNPDTVHSEDGAEETFETLPQSPRKLPDDLPTSLDDRRSFPSYGGETEMYDAWQGSCICFQNNCS